MLLYYVALNSAGRKAVPEPAHIYAHVHIYIRIIRNEVECLIISLWGSLMYFSN